MTREARYLAKRRAQANPDRRIELGPAPHAKTTGKRLRNELLAAASRESR